MSRERIVVSKSTDIGWETLDEIARTSGGFIRGSGPEGEYAEVWHGEDKAYTFKGEGLVAFLYAIKDKHVTQLYAALDLCDYIAKAKNAQPSVFVRDAIVARAQVLQDQIKGGAS